MKIYDEDIGQKVDVCEPECPDRYCYWPRPDPGIFTQGKGYRTRKNPRGYICGYREIRGCPEEYH